VAWDSSSAVTTTPSGVVASNVCVASIGTLTLKPRLPPTLDVVMPPARDGGQRQYVEAPVPQRPPVSIASTVDWAMARLGAPIGIGDLAGHAGMSDRTFHRAFVAATGSTPGRWLSVQRIRLAQRLLETTPLTVDRVAQRSGMGTAANLRRRMKAQIGVSPDSYRRTFAAPAQPISMTALPVT
jgi:transcriptional regulator GlxA family with amidase domain